MIRTVLGDVDRLGVTNSHDHLFFASKALPGQELDDVGAALVELQRFCRAGGRAVVQWTPYGLNRRLDALPDLSRRSGVSIVAATGFHQVQHYSADFVAESLPRLEELFVNDIRHHRAGLVKIAGGFHGLDAHAVRTMEAAAAAHHETGAPVSVHLELGTGALDVLDLLCGRLEMPPERVILGHLNRFPDVWAQRRAAEAGAWLALDGPSRANHATDWMMPTLLVDLADAGFAGQLLVGGDTTTAGARGMPGMAYLLKRLRPRLEAELAEQVFVVNPGRAFDAF
ncbi:phosphotriesterase [Kutzneria buriramensis]|uniref:Phosphotriesterase-related protein n=1 Tax=Kutzneria buriramensis TaxID=1045776 RepID=A0A3E0HLA4_9PSEU|nr:phosphotriesterase [Kutzneria buriramensis]REH47158.1 phosphotriesterase-related protein [Kutzneria buriramensis]